MEANDKDISTIEGFPTFFRIHIAPNHIKGAVDLMGNLNATSFKGDILPLGYQYDYGKKILKVHRGVGLKYLSKFFPRYTYVMKEGMKSIALKESFTVNKTPFDYQEKIRDKAHASYIETDDKVFVCNLPTGRGKSLTTLFIAALLKTPFLIIVKNEAIRNPWFKSFMKSTNLKMDTDIYEIVGGGGFNHILSMTKPYKGYVIKHQSIRHIIKEYGYIGLNKMLFKAGIGLKVIDEFDTEFSSTIDIDLNTAIKYNLYLTATVYKNDKSEDKVFQTTFQNVTQMGKEFFPNYKPNRIGELVYFKSYPDPKDRFCCLNKVSDFSPYLYNDYLFDKRKEMLTDLIKPYIEKFKVEFPKESKICLYVEKKDACKKMCEILVKQFGVSLKDIAIVNDDVQNKDYSKKWIISTNKSMGRGIDVDNLDFGINLENYAGPSILEQQAGRFGRIGNPQEGFFVTVVDCSYQYIRNWNATKDERMKDFFKAVNKKYYNSKTKTYVASEEDI